MRGVDAYWILGDIVALGPDPVEVLERLSTLPNVRCIRGNTERYICTGGRTMSSWKRTRWGTALKRGGSITIVKPSSPPWNE